jgi:hypothetical protein
MQRINFKPELVVRFQSAANWAEKYFSEDSRPPEPTVRRWMQSGKVPAKKIGGSWFIDEDAWLAGGDVLVERVLAATVS